MVFLKACLSRHSGITRNKSDIPFRDFKAENGESWNDVYNRAKSFFGSLIKTQLEGEEAKEFEVNIQSSVDVGDDYSSLKNSTKPQSKS